MSRTLKYLVAGLGFLAVSLSAQASPLCLKDPKPFDLSLDTVNWTMSAAPGSECIQGLRHSTMLISNITVWKPPTKGKIVLVGTGFRYFADPASHEADSFTLLVIGQNRHEAGTSVVEVSVKSAPGNKLSEAIEPAVHGAQQVAAHERGSETQ